MQRIGLVGLILTATFASPPAIACNGATVLFEDKFVEADPGWSNVGEAATIENGALTITANPGYHLSSWYLGNHFDNADICVDLTMPALKDPKAVASAGLDFWWTTGDAYYFFWIATDGNYGVSRRLNKSWLRSVSARKADGLKTGPGDVNRLRATLQGNTVTVSINDKKQITFKANAPPGGGLIGFAGESELTSPTPWAFSNLKVTEPTP